MNEEKEFLEQYVLPRFELPATKKVVWGEQTDEEDSNLIYFTIGQDTFILGENGMGGFSHDNPQGWFEDYDEAPSMINPIELKDRYQTKTNKYVCDLSEEETKKALKAFLPERQFLAMLTNSGKLKYSEPPFTDTFVIVKK